MPIALKFIIFLKTENATIGTLVSDNVMRNIVHIYEIHSAIARGLSEKMF